jgi:hypothetical protein
MEAQINILTRNNGEARMPRYFTRDCSFIMSIPAFCSEAIYALSKGSKDTLAAIAFIIKDAEA